MMTEARARAQATGLGLTLVFPDFDPGLGSFNPESGDARPSQGNIMKGNKTRYFQTNWLINILQIVISPTLALE